VSFIGFADVWGDQNYDAIMKLAPPAGIKVLGNERYARTDIPVLILPDLIQVVAELDTSDISTMAIQPGHLADTINYRGLPVLNTDRVRAAVRNVMNGLGSGDSVIDGDECGS